MKAQIGGNRDVEMFSRFRVDKPHPVIEVQPQIALATLPEQLVDDGQILKEKVSNIAIESSDANPLVNRRASTSPDLRASPLH